MKVSDLTPDLFRRALDVYVERAYPDGGAPPQAEIDTQGLTSSQDVLDLFEVEELEGGSIVHYVLRLGNANYPHMKLSLVPFYEPAELAWCVDTHDRLPAKPGSADWKRTKELRVHNLQVKASVEAGWREAGLDTPRVVAERIPESEQAERGPLVLVVDDEDGMRSAAVKILRSAGYRVVEAASALRAIERYVQECPDLVLMDYEMPGMDGLELCARLREVERVRGDRTPMLMATAGNLDLREEPGLDGFLVKPYQRRLLLSFVQHQLPGKLDEA